MDDDPKRRRRMDAASAISVMIGCSGRSDRRDFRRLAGNVQLFERNVDGEISVEPIPALY